MLVGEPSASAPLAGHEHPVAGAAQRPHRDRAHLRVVLHHQDGLGSPRAAARAGPGAARSARTASAAAGRWISKVVPSPGLLSTVTCPPLCVTMP